jgi:hypothetical protein
MVLIAAKVLSARRGIIDHFTLHALAFRLQEFL